jgi:endo-1,4-beta-xylanase
MNRRLFLKIAGGGAAGLFSAPRLAFAAENRLTPPTGGDLLERAADRIEQVRKGDGVVVVRNRDRKPVNGARITIEQTRHNFLFGCNAFRVGRIADAAREEEYRRRFASVFNYATLGFYWAAYEAEQGHPQYAYTDRVVDWCRQNKIACKGHPLVWDYADPSWLPREFAQIRTLSRNRVREIVARFQNRIERWDVVNEPTHLGRFHTRLGEWALSLGAVPYTIEHLQVARAANPQATLVVNDYRTDPEYFHILDRLRRQDKLLFDALGIQSHMHDGVWPLARAWEVCDVYRQFAVPIHFTETTIVSGQRLAGGRWGPTLSAGEAAQADYVPKFYTALFAHPAVQAITWWDFSDDQAWQGAAAGWVRSDMTPKPVYERMLDLIKRQWWTKAEGRTNAQGEFPCRAFYGHHRVSIQWPDGGVTAKEVHWERGRPNRFELGMA